METKQINDIETKRHNDYYNIWAALSFILVPAGGWVVSPTLAGFPRISTPHIQTFYILLTDPQLQHFI